MKALYANNAKTTLANGIGASDLTLVLTDATLFPSPLPANNEYFLCTLELDGVVEIVEVRQKTGNSLTIAADGRGKEGTTARAYPAGSRVECRTTRDTLVRLSKTFLPLADVESLLAPSAMYQDGYICNTYDPYGNPVAVMKRDEDSWRSLNYTLIQAGTVDTGTTTTSVTATSITATVPDAGKYLIQFTSGTYTGQIRPITAVTTTTASWTTALAGVPSNGDTFEIWKSNASMLMEASQVSDDALVNAIVFGE